MKTTHDFKPGEVIELIDGELPHMPLGSRVVVEEQSSAAAPSSVTYMEKDGSLTWRPADYFRRIGSPIRTVTRRIISRGEYGCVKVGKHELSTNTLAVEMVCTRNGFMRSADELRSAAMVLSQLAEFLDEDKGDE